MKLLILIFLNSVCAFAYIPNISNALGEVFEGRKGGLQEIVLKHRVFNPGGEPIEIEEVVLFQGNKVFLVFKVGSVLIPGEFSERKYKLVGSLITAKSLMFLRYLTSSSADDYRDLALKEQFIRREQLTEFQPTFKAEGDPQTWALKDNYIRLESVAFKKLKQGVAVAYKGGSLDGEERTLYLDPSYKGIKRLEWQEGKENHSWNFDGFTKMTGSGYFPRVITFESNGAEIIVSNLLSFKQSREKTVAEYKKLLGRTPAQPTVEGMNALRLLLSYR